MAPTILVAGATGNTGRNVVQTLSTLLSTGKTLPGHTILAQTRSANSPVAQQLAQLPGVQVVEQNWVEFTADWLRQHQVVRAFIASHNQPNQFAEESTFHLAALQAGVEYVVRISTTAANVRPDYPAYYPRSHWAIESMLSSPAFKAVRWTSLQPNIFTAMYLASAAELVKGYRKTGNLDTLRLIAAEDAPIGVIDADDVGAVAAHLLVEKDTDKHNQAKYVLNGPEDLTGRQIVTMVEDHIGTKVKNIQYKDLSFIDQMAEASSENKSVILSIKHAPETAWAGECTASTTSKEVFEIAAPRTTPAETFKALLEE
jgi:uncharacterized protein YbjT (DUF2867 family)